MNYENILTENKNNVLVITLNRPENYNAFDEKMRMELLDALKSAERDKLVRAIVIRGAGEKAFSSGQDLKEYSIVKKSIREIIEKSYNPIIKLIRTIEKPIIGMINGVAAGAGFSIALACDMRIMSSSAKLIQAFVRIGLVADSGSHFFLPRLVGMARAFEYATTGREISAEEALQVGLVNKIFPINELENETLKIATQFAEGPTKAIGIIKRTLNKSLASDLETLMAYEAQMQELASKTEDHAEGVKAFLEKRKAIFLGK